MSHGGKKVKIIVRFPATDCPTHWSLGQWRAAFSDGDPSRDQRCDIWYSLSGGRLTKLKRSAANWPALSTNSITQPLVMIQCHSSLGRERVDGQIIDVHLAIKGLYQHWLKSIGPLKHSRTAFVVQVFRNIYIFCAANLDVLKKTGHVTLWITWTFHAQEIFLWDLTL